MDFKNIKEVLNWRYSTKSFDKTKKISLENEENIKALLQLSPSSINSQPWHFVIAKTDEGKKRLAKGVSGFFSFNQQKVLNASHVVLFCAKTEIDTLYLQHIVDKEFQDGRYANEEYKNQGVTTKNIFTNIHKYDLKDAQHWMEKQVYLNIGNFLLGVASLSIDAVPMEGIDAKLLDEELELRKRGYTAICMVALGYRASDDFNATLPKSRLNKDELFTEV
ncbi:oxygen-insensitive NAD(P)H nitroreductase [Tenacibaculum sp. UWU-22]|uniref:oxygen-insensitive NAD(P)H nitroreductase n=1 Tax=Tenacibaculum sp. UWU-22 TaxID=3234187 RepID=UPI0034DB4C90